MRCLIALALGASILLATTTAAANPAERKAVMTEYVELLAFPNVADNREDMERLTAHLVKAMERRGLAPRILRGPDSKTPPAIYGEWRVSGASKTLVLYAHHDGQPVDPKDWTLSKPFEPTFRTGKPGAWSAPLALPSNPNDWPKDLGIFARSASDDKLGVMAIFAAIDRLKAKGAAPTFNLKMLFDGEEEAGSTGLPSILAANRDLLRSDGWVIFDEPSHSNGQPQVVLGVRGVTSVELTTFGPNRGLHSGHYGNWAPDPSFRLARLLASMKDKNGRVTIAGFYDDSVPLSSSDRAALAVIPNEDSRLRQELGLAATDSPGQALAEALTRPSLDVLGMRSADVGLLARNVIPTTATATLGLRLTKGDDVARQVERLRAHIRSQGFWCSTAIPPPKSALATL